jgi:enolase
MKGIAMASDRSYADEHDILGVLQTKSEMKAFYNKIAGVYDLLAEHSEQPMREIAMSMLAPALGVAPENVLFVGDDMFRDVHAAFHCIQ